MQDPEQKAEKEAHRVPSLRTAFNQGVGVNCCYGLQA
jgi:hypothetical protein